MNWNEKTLSFLNLDKKEKDILSSLNSSKSIQEVAKEVSYPRSTIAYTIKKLLRRNLIQTIQHGKRIKYISLSQHELLATILKAADELNINTKDKKGALVKASKDSEFAIHVGVIEIITSFEKITSLNKYERVKAIQPNKSWQMQHKKLTLDGEVRFNNALKENKIIVEGIVESDAYKLMAEIYKNDPTTLQELGGSFEGRMADYTSAPQGYFTHQAELFIFKSTVLFINWKDEIAIEITNQDIFDFTCDMFNIVKENGKKIDHNQEIRNILSK